MSACFVGTRLAGVTRQLLEPNEAGLRVRYRGSIGPVDLGSAAQWAVERIGAALAEAFGLVGLFGVDFLMDRDGPRAVEINPRYTASVEVIEEGLGIALLSDDPRAFEAASRRVHVAAKVILRARRPAVVPEAWPWSDPLDPRPAVADLPAAGTILRPGDPVLSVLARGDEVLRLRASVSLWRAQEPSNLKPCKLFSCIGLA